jgi:3',5'-nucleoside bisphosphate phosphatase
MRVDLHSHSKCSDGLDSPAELVRHMAYAGLEAFALTDHDTLQGLPEAREEANKLGVELISGAEISAEYDGQDDIHILALFVDENNDRFNRRLLERQENRRTRGERMAQKLVEHGYALDLDVIREEVGTGVWARPHIARALVRAGHAKSQDDAFDRFLGREHPWYVASEKWPALDVVDAIREAGGVSSIAHAVWYENGDLLIRELAARGLDAIEVFHPDHGPAEEARFGNLARELGLAMTAGSDFHGTPEGRKHPGGVAGTGEMLGILKTLTTSRARRA